MNASVTVLLCVVAVLASALAVAAGTNAATAVPAAAIAVAAGALLLVEVVPRTRWPPGRPLPNLEADPSRIRSSLVSGSDGRHALVLLLDNLERAGGMSNRSNTTVEELARVRAMDPEEFRTYVADRLNFLERQT